MFLVETAEKPDRPFRTGNPETLENTKIVLTGSPRGRFEHSGVLPGAKCHVEHDGNSEIMNQRHRVEAT